MLINTNITPTDAFSLGGNQEIYFANFSEIGTITFGATHGEITAVGGAAGVTVSWNKIELYNETATATSPLVEGLTQHFNQSVAFVMDINSPELNKIYRDLCLPFTRLTFAVVEKDSLVTKFYGLSNGLGKKAAEASTGTADTDSNKATITFSGADTFGPRPLDSTKSFVASGSHFHIA